MRLLFEDVRIIYGNARTRLHLALTGDGSLYILKPDATAWISIVFSDPVVDALVTTGTVDGITYIYFSGSGAYTYNEATDLFTPVTLIGLSDTIIGITGSYGYLVAYTEDAIAWSSTVAPNDFTPSAVTGAGGGAVSDIDGAILFCVPNSLGFLIYSEANVVAAVYTGNVKFPFKLREVTNSKGALNLDLVAYEANAVEHFAFGKAGIQAVDSQNATTFLPEVTDFLTGQQIEDFNEITKVFTITDLETTLLKKVKLIASRYLVISYGISTFTHALVYDVTLKRAGKLRQDHTDIFEYIGGVHQEVARHTLGVLLTTGEVVIADWSVPDATSGTLILGRYQYVRERTLRMQQVDVRNVEAASVLTVTALVAIAGDTITSVVPGYESYTGTKKRSYLFDVEGLNILIALVGKMDINTVTVTFTIGGRS